MVGINSNNQHGKSMSYVSRLEEARPPGGPGKQSEPAHRGPRSKFAMSKLLALGLGEERPIDRW